MRKRLLFFALLFAGGVLAAEPIAVIAYPGIPKTDANSLQRLYTGRSVSIRQHLSVPVNLPAWHPSASSFWKRCSAGRAAIHRLLVAGATSAKVRHRGAGDSTSAWLHPQHSLPSAICRCGRAIRGQHYFPALVARTAGFLFSEW